MDKNWESFCHYVASTTVLQELNVTFGETDGVPPAIMDCTTLLLNAMEDNKSIVQAKFYLQGSYHCSDLWNSRAPSLLERNRVRAIATAPAGIRRQLLSKCLGHDMFQTTQASVLYLALKLSEIDEDFTSRLQALMLTKRAKIEQNRAKIEHNRK
jgi:hypothetical protein